MSDDSFGRNDRTIIRPNPGGRRLTPQAPAPPASPPHGISQPPPVVPSAGSGEEWVTGSQRPPPAPEAAPRPVVFRQEHLNAPNENPVIRAAGPLLLALGQFRASMVRAPSAELMEQVAEAIQEFERKIRAAGLTADQVNVAKYVLCATADDIVQNMPVDDRQVWLRYSMLSRFFGERQGGVRFFEELERAKADPAINYPVLELMHACLALGFEGIHRTSVGGASALQGIQRNLYETLRRIKSRTTDELSPHWQGQMLAARTGMRRIPVWATTAVLAVFLFGFFITLRALLGGEADAVSAKLASLVPSGMIALDRPQPAPPPPPPPPPPQPAKPRALTQLERIRLAMAAEIKADKAYADQTADDIILTVGNVAVFASGSSEVLESFKPIAAKIGDTLEKEPGFIRVIGHTDNQPIKTVRFASNHDLSIERAKNVADLIRERISKPDRLVVDGKGADMPVASNATPEGRQKNRRVEIIIPRAD